MNIPEIYIGVNEYIDKTTGESMYVYTKSYSKIRNAKAAATRAAFSDGKKNPPIKIGNEKNMTFSFTTVPGWNGSTREVRHRNYHSYFEYVRTTIFKASEWSEV